MQYGASQLFEREIPKYLSTHTSARIFVSPVWANGPENFVDFFIPDKFKQQIIFESGEGLFRKRYDFKPDDLVFLTAQEYEKIQNNPVFSYINVEKTIPYPDGTIGFYVIRLEYAKNYEELYRRVLIEERKPVLSKVKFLNQTVQVWHSRLGYGDITAIFDGNPNTLVRGLSANPFTIKIVNEIPLTIQKISLTTGTMNFAVKTEIISTSNNGSPYLLNNTFLKQGPDPTVIIPLADIQTMVNTITMEVTDLDKTDTAEIHIRDLTFN
jgi:hypothetical protein